MQLFAQVDYTVPDVIHGMAEFYVRHRTPFVMGTTGGDRARLMREVSAHQPVLPKPCGLQTTLGVTQ